MSDLLCLLSIALCCLYQQAACPARKKRFTFARIMLSENSESGSPVISELEHARSTPSGERRAGLPRRNKRGMVRLRRCAQLVFLLTSFTNAQSMCSASLRAVIPVCQDNACNSAAIELGDTVTFQVCVENSSFEIPGTEKTTPVSGVLQADTEIEIFLACTSGTASHCPPH